jgi:uncharacterized membrane protein YedE/YeeE
MKVTSMKATSMKVTSMKPTSMKVWSALLGGIIFGAGLAASGMTSTQKVQGFLDVFGEWQADLLFVMVSAVLVTIISFRFILSRAKPLFDVKFHLPNATSIDFRLIAGAVIFGLGWGVYGYCPGPAIAALSYFQTDGILFIVAMVAGMTLSGFYVKFSGR